MIGQTISLFLTEVQASMRAAHSFGTEMFGFLDRVPYLTARLSIPGEARRAIAQFDSVPKEHHNRNSIAVYSASQPSLRAQVLAITADAKNISPALQFEIDSMQEINCDDTIDEEPHAAMKRIIAASRRGNFPWQSASVSLNQTLQDARDLPSALEVDSQDLWNRYTSLLQVKQKSWNRPMRISRTKFEERMYTLVTLDGLDVDRDHQGPDVDDDLDMDDPASSSCRPNKIARKSAASSSIDLHSEMEKLDDDARMMSEWLVSVMVRYAYIVVVVPDAGPTDDKMHVFQVLSIKPKQALVKTFDQASPIRYGLKASVQPLEVWRAVELNSETDELFAVAVSGPIDVDLLKYASAKTEDRLAMIRVHQVPSDLEGCICLSKCEPLVPSCSLHDESVPVICLLDELTNQGFVGKDSLISHSPYSAKVFDQRHAPSKRAYFQCVLAKTSIFEKGVRRFSSGRPNAFYMLLLRSKVPVDESTSAAECKQQLAILSGDFHVPAALANKPPVRSRLQGTVSDDESVDGSGMQNPPVVSEPVRSQEDPGSETTSNSDSSSESSSASSSVDGDGPLHDFPECIMGMPHHIEHHRRRKDHGLRVSCCNHDHAACKKFRSIRKDTTVFGAQAPFLFLSAWMSKAFEMSRDEHKDYMPSRGDIRSFMAEQEQE